MTDAIADEPSVADEGLSDRWVKLGVLAGLALLSAAAAAYEITPASVTPLVMPGLGIGSVAAGWIVSVMYGTAVLTSVPVGVGLDRWDPRTALTLAGVALLVAGAWGWLAASTGAYRSLLASRMLGGLAYVVVWNAGIDVVGSTFEAHNRATAVGVFTAAAPAGFALGQFGGPRIAAVFGWPAIFPAFAAIGAAGVLVFRPASRHVEVAAGRDSPSAADLRAVFTDRRVVAVSSLAFLGYSLYLFLNSWMPTYLTEELGLSLADSGLLVALFPAVGLVARAGSGAVSDRLFAGRRRPVARLSFLVSVPAMLGFAVLDSVALVFGLLVVAGLSIQLCLGLVFTYVSELVESAVRGTTIAFATGVGLFGAFVAPIAAGSLIEATGSYRPAFLAAGALAVLGLALAVVAPEPSA